MELGRGILTVVVVANQIHTRMSTNCNPLDFCHISCRGIMSAKCDYGLNIDLIILPQVYRCAISIASSVDRSIINRNVSFWKLSDSIDNSTSCIWSMCHASIYILSGL